jgi:CMP-N,N'-diacetyllegionaminic acid synthase
MGISIEKNWTIALVPAKMTSIRLPKKNIANFHGHPLFYYSVKAAQLAKHVSSVYVSSESNEVSELTKNFKANFIKRPEYLSLPKIKNIDVLIHALENISIQSEAFPEFIVLLQPTHPLRNPLDIDKAIELLKNDKKADVLISVISDNRLSGEIENNRYISQYLSSRNKRAKPESYINTGSFYIFRTSTTILQGRIFTENILPYKLDNPEFEIDIDYKSDFELAKCMLEINKDKFSFYWDDI